MLQLVLPLQGGDGRLGKHPETGSERGRGWGVRWTPVMFCPPPPQQGSLGVAGAVGWDQHWHGGCCWESWKTPKVRGG